MAEYTRMRIYHIKYHNSLQCNRRKSWAMINNFLKWIISFFNNYSGRKDRLYPKYIPNICTFLIELIKCREICPFLSLSLHQCSYQGCFTSPQGTFGNVWKHSGCHNWGEGCSRLVTGIKWVEVRDDTKHSPNPA